MPPGLVLETWESARLRRSEQRGDVYSLPMNPLRVIRLFFVAAPGLICIAVPGDAQKAEIVTPLHTDGHRIVDASGHAVRLTSVNWYGFDEKEYVAGGLDHAPLEQIVDQIRQIGVNSVRLPWANETLEHDPLRA